MRVRVREPVRVGGFGWEGSGGGFEGAGTCPSRDSCGARQFIGRGSAGCSDLRGSAALPREVRSSRAARTKRAKSGCGWAGRSRAPCSPDRTRRSSRPRRRPRPPCPRASSNRSRSGSRSRSGAEGWGPRVGGRGSGTEGWGPRLRLPRSARRTPRTACTGACTTTSRRLYTQAPVHHPIQTDPSRSSRRRGSCGYFGTVNV